MMLVDLFKKTLVGPWQTAGNETQYKLIVTDDVLYLCFQGSSQKEDWKFNFAFPVRPFRFGSVRWLAHGGIVKAWKACRKQIVAEVMMILDERKLVIVGYSHGAMLTVMAHEQFKRYMGLNVESFAFAPARVMWMPNKMIKDWFDGLTTVMCRGDVVTHVPPALMGYRHVGKVIRLGADRLIGVKAHLAGYMLEVLEACCAR